MKGLGREPSEEAFLSKVSSLEEEKSYTE
jgi:hypothetical protein